MHDRDDFNSFVLDSIDQTKRKPWNFALTPAASDLSIHLGMSFDAVKSSNQPVKEAPAKAFLLKVIVGD